MTDVEMLDGEDGYLADVGTVDMVELRRRRTECEELETELSYVRRLLQGRIDILDDELARRAEGKHSNATELISRLPSILADGPGGPQQRSTRLMRMLAPAQVSRVEKEVEQMVGMTIADVASATAEEIEAAIERLRTGEVEVSQRRRILHKRLDAIHGELARRYRDGEADVDSLLATER